MASLETGIRVSIAPRFHSAMPWADRLRVNSGADIVGDKVVPRNDWREPTATELALLTESQSDESLVLFNIPEHLRSSWWDLAARELPFAGGEFPGFNAFAAKVLEFLQFKMLPLPPTCKLELVIRAPGLTAEQSKGTMLGSINLGDEQAALVFLNLAPGRLSECHEYPMVRIRIQPGEGFWLPTTGVFCHADTRGRMEPDIQLFLTTATPE